jgi:hypothetical protein
MSATVSNAEAYFAPTNHIRAATWAKFEADQKAAAIAQAKRVLARAASVDDIETELDLDTGMSAEYAIYEQALWMLTNTPMANADETMPLPEATDPETESNARRAQTAIIAPEAMRWLTYDQGVTLERG